MTTQNIDFKVKNGLHLNGQLGVTVAGNPNYGTAGQALVSAGPGLPPVWATPSSVIVSDTAPLSPNNSDLWWNSATGVLKIYYDDGTSAQWVDAVTTTQGYTGSVGTTGAVGFTGSQGIQGDIGYTGSRGDVGYTGSQGAMGFTGSTGGQGDPGSIGYTGSKGESGIGFTIAKTYASVAALTADTSPIGIIAGQFALIETNDVNNPENSRLYLWSGTTYSYVTDLSGAQGITGAQGIQGYTGSAGATGATGFTGSAGATGFTGSTGANGATGYTGSAGVVGYTGSAGVTSTTDELLSASIFYPTMTDVVGGASLFTSSAKLGFAPSTGTLYLGYEPAASVPGPGMRMFYDPANYELRIQHGSTDWSTQIGVVPNGSSTVASLTLYGGSDTANSSHAFMDSDGYFGTRSYGTAPAIPLRLSVNATEYFRIGTQGQFGPVTGGTTADFGTAGQVLTSGGPSAPPTWTTPTGGGGGTPTIEMIDLTTSPNPFYLLMAPTDGAQTTYYADMGGTNQPLKYDRVNGRLSSQELETTSWLTFYNQELVLDGETRGWGSSSDSIRLGKDVMPYGSTDSVGIGFGFASGTDSVAIGNANIPGMGPAAFLSLNTSVLIGNGIFHHQTQTMSMHDSVAIGYRTNRYLNLDNTGVNPVTYSTIIGAYAGALEQQGFGAPTALNNSSNTALGAYALFNTYGSFNVAVGVDATRYSFNPRELNYTTTVGAYSQVMGDNATAIGANTIAYANEIQLGDSATTAYVYGTVQNRSDLRDKTAVRDTVLGLDFIMSLRPVDYKWDMRDDYLIKPPKPLSANATEEEKAAHAALVEQYRNQTINNITHDGTHTRERYHHGFIAQDVEQLIQETGVDFGGYQDHTINGGPEVKSIGYDELIAPLVKAIQELKAEFEEYKRTHP